MKRRTKILFFALTAFLTAVIVYCVIYLFGYYKETEAANEIYNEAQSLVSFDKLREEVKSKHEESETKKTGTSVVINMDKLKKKYPDACGYLYQEDFISLPVAQATDNEFYLHRDLAGNYLYAGCLFFDCGNTNHSRRLVIYGHNMKNGTMFGDMDFFLKKSYFDSHSLFYLGLGQKTYQCSVICLKRTNAGSYVYDTDAIGEEEFKIFIEKMKTDAIFVNSDVTVTENDGTLLLSTCTTGDGRLTLFLKVCGLNGEIKKERKVKYLYEE